MRLSICLFLLACFLWTPPTAKAGGAPKWIWTESVTDDQKSWFRGEFEIHGVPKAATFAGTCDDSFRVLLNGKLILTHRKWDAVAMAPASEALVIGGNILAVEAENRNSSAGLIGRLTVETADGQIQTIVTNDDWRATNERHDGWEGIDFDWESWPAAVELGEIGAENLPWSKAVTLEALERAETTRYDLAPKAAPVSELNLLPGFKAERLYTVPKPIQGSWVSLAVLPDGSLVASDQGDAGLYHIRPAVLGDPDSRTTVERLPADIGNAQGLLWAFDSLYVVVNSSGRSGLFRVTDGDGDGTLERTEKLRHLDAGGEHGPHAVILTEDGEGLYVCGGNHSPLPEIDGSRAPASWEEDLLLPRQWDARGHAKGVLAPGGWVCRVSPDGKHWEVISNGYRNQYDIDLNTDGEMFTFDADMEWDFGMPWYRPTRINHVVSGSEFGWRSGSGKWPVYYEDSLPPVVDIGPGSPTGVVFGTGAKFPAKYQKAFYALDWTFGTIYAIHLQPHGASYTGVPEEFISGAPLPVTDAVVGADGAFYFAVGGRGTDSALYRVYYDGDESIDSGAPRDPEDAVEARRLRRDLEAFHGKRDPNAVEAAWPHLSSTDRFIRFAARIAVENQPVGEWKDRAFSEENPLAAGVAAIGVARQGAPSLQTELLESLLRFDLSEVDETTALVLTRAYSLALSRMGRPGEVMRRRIVERLDPHLPSGSDDLNAELVRLLVYLDGPNVIEKGLALMAEAGAPKVPDWAELLKRNPGYGGTIQTMLDNHPPSAKINYAFMLRNVRYGWSLEQREAYFRFINDAAHHPGGASYSGFLENIRDEALENCSEAEKAALAEITGKSLQPLPEFEVRQPLGPYREWTLPEASALVEREGLRGRNFENGRNAYYAVGCAACHRFDGAGGNIGPDLSSVGAKFSFGDLLEAILEPSKVISDQYGSSVVTLLDGDSYQGIVVNRSGSLEEDEIEIYTSDPKAPPVRVKTVEVETIEPSEVSQMPTGLLDFLNEGELLDLLAYLASRGNPEAEFFKE